MKITKEEFNKIHEDYNMSKFLITGLYHEIIEAKTPTEAWAEYVCKKDGADFKKFWGNDEAREEIQKLGYSKIKTTKIKNVFKLII